jgi:arylsulfatase A-like enzyme
MIKTEKKVFSSTRASRHSNNLLRYLYMESIKKIDICVGQLLSILKKTFGLQNTYVIFTADHGQAFMEHGVLGHSMYLYEELVRIPLIIRGPMIPRTTIDTPVSLIGLPTTILGLSGNTKPVEYDGESLLSSTGDQFRVDKGNKPIFAEGQSYPVDRPLGRRQSGLDRSWQCKLVSCRVEGWKYIWSQRDQDELYNLVADPEEKRNLVEKKPSIASDLKRRIDTHIESVDESRPIRELHQYKAEAKEQEMLRRRLEDLGYL